MTSALKEEDAKRRRRRRGPTSMEERDVLPWRRRAPSKDADDAGHQAWRKETTCLGRRGHQARMEMTQTIKHGGRKVPCCKEGDAKEINNRLKRKHEIGRRGCQQCRSQSQHTPSLLDPSLKEPIRVELEGHHSKWFCEHICGIEEAIHR